VNSTSTSTGNDRAVRGPDGIQDRLANGLSLERIARDTRALYETDKTYCYREMLKTADRAAALLR